MITGSIVALVTPMFPSGAIDWDALARLVEWHIDQKTDAIVAVGTTGESATLDYAEHAGVIKHIVDVANGRIPIIAGTGANSTQEAIDLTQAAKAHGADACLLVTPYYNKPTQEGLYQHHMQVADQVDIPQILYNVPGRTACDMLPATVHRLATHRNIVAIKEATGEISRVDAILSGCPDDFAVYSGDDASAVELILNGGKGNISVTANVAPRQMAAVCAEALAGRAEQAHQLDKSLEILHSVLFLESNPIPVKWALAEMKKIDRGIRLPLTPLDVSYHDRLSAALRQCGLID